MAKVVVMVDEVIVGVTLALVIIEVWQKKQAAQARRVYLLLEVSKGHTMYKPGTIALWEICHYQKSVELLIRILPFCWLVWEIKKGIKSNYRVQANTLKELQEVAEAFLVHLLEDANWCAIHTKHVTVMLKDFYLMQKFQGVHFNPMWK